MGKYYLIERAKAKGIDISAEGLEQENIWDLFTAIDEKWDLIAQEPTANNQTPEPQERVTTPAAQTPPESTEEPTFEPTVNPTSKPKKEPPEPPAKPKDKEKVVVDTPKPKPESPGKPGAKGKEPVDAVKEGALEIELLSRKKDEKCQIIESDFKIINTSGKDIDLKKVKIRYYFTREGRANLEPAVYTYSKQNIKDKNYFKQKNTQDVKISFHKVSDSNMYMEIKFASGVLKKDEYVYIMTGFNNDKWDRMDQTNDYSYIADSNDFEVTQKVTGYISDKLVWGIEPY